MDALQLLEKSFEAAERESVGSVRFGLGRVVVDLQKDAVDPGGHGGAGQHGDELGLASADRLSSGPAGGGGSLDGVGGVEDDGRELAQDGQRAHIDDEIVVAEAGATLAEADPLIAGIADLGDGMAHVRRSDELAFFNVDRPAGLGGGDEQVGLAAEEGGNLEHGFGVAESVREPGAVLRGVDVGENGNAKVAGDGAEDARAFDQARAAEAADAGAVGLIVAGLEDPREAQLGGDPENRLGERAGVSFGLEDAGSGDEEEVAAADGDGGQVEGVLGGVGHWTIEAEICEGVRKTSLFARAGCSYRQHTSGHRANIPEVLPVALFQMNGW